MPRSWLTAAVCAIALGGATLGAQAAGPAPKDGVALPDTPAGRVAAEFLRVVNAGDAARSRAFAVSYEAEDPRDEGQIAEVVANHRSVHERAAPLVVREVLRATPTKIFLLARDRTGRDLRVMVEVQDMGGGKYRIVDVGLRPAQGAPPLPPEPGGSGSPAARPALSTAAARAPARGDDERRRLLETYWSRIAAYGFSGAALVAHRGRVIFSAAAGMADRDAGVPNTTETVFNTGSLTKQFTAAAILKLEMQGRLRTTDSIGSYLPGVPEDKRGITLRQLLTHTSGIRGTPGAGLAPDRDQEVAAILADSLLWPPGTRFRYANEGYALLGAVVERVSGQGLDAFLQAQLFDPAGMRSTGYRRAGVERRRVVHEYAAGRDNGSMLDRPHPNWKSMGNGEILTTLADMHRWYLALRGDALLSADAKRKLFTPAMNEYAYGWAVHDTPYGTEIEHDGGSTTGTAADMRFYPDSDLVVISFGNVDAISMLLGHVRERLRAIAQGADAGTLPPAPVPLAPAALERFAGRYRLPSGDVLTVVRDGGALRLTGEGLGAGALLALGESRPPAQWAERGAQAAAIAMALARGDTAPLLAAQPMRPQMVGRLRDGLAELTAQRGALRAATPVAVRPFPGGPDAIETVVRLEFERGSPTHLLTIWSPRGLGGWQLAETVASPGGRYVPISATELAALDWHSGAVRRIGFSKRAGGHYARLAAGGETATRE